MVNRLWYLLENVYLQKFAFSGHALQAPPSCRQVLALSIVEHGGHGA